MRGRLRRDRVSFIARWFPGNWNRWMDIEAHRRGGGTAVIEVRFDGEWLCTEPMPFRSVEDRRYAFAEAYDIAKAVWS